jgi:hypothetical protein
MPLQRGMQHFEGLSLPLGMEHHSASSTVRDLACDSCPPSSLSSCPIRLWPQVVDWVPLASPSQTDKYCVQAGGGPLSITLVWTDRPCDLNAALCIVNDLDLTVHASGLAGYTLYGNGLPDRINTVEQVHHGRGRDEPTVDARGHSRLRSGAHTPARP